MTARETVTRLAQTLASDPDISGRLLSVIWIGSHSHQLDLHGLSDLDIQLVLDEPDVTTIMALARVLAEFPALDLSILYPKDVWNDAGELDFQDGTKGAFFIPVLANGKVLHGTDFYAALRRTAPADAVRSSLRFTIREYLGRLRVMALDASVPGPPFNKYVMKLLKDLLIYADLLSTDEMTSAPNDELVALADRLIPPEAHLMLGRLKNYSDHLTVSERALVLVALEKAFDAIERRNPGLTYQPTP